MQNRSLNLIKNTGIYFVGNFSSKLLIFFLLPLYTLYLNPSEYGTIDLYINILGIVYSVVSLQSIESVFRFIQDASSDEEKSVVISNSLIVTGIGLCVYGVIMLFLEIFTGFQYTVIFFLYATSNILTQYYLQAIRGLNKSLEYSLSGILSTLIQVICNIIFIIVLGIGGISLLLAFIIANIFVILFLIIKINILKYFDIKYIKRSVIKEQLRYSIPLMPNALCLWAISSLGRYLLLFFYSPNEVGLLAFALKFPMLLSTVNNIFFMAWQQSAISEYSSNDKKIFYSQVFNKFVVLQLSLLIIIFPIVKIMIFTIMGPAYREAWVFIPLFFVAVLFNSYANFYSMGFYSAKKTNTIFFASVSTLIIYLVLGFFMAKYFYITGIGIAYSISQLVYWLIMKYRVKNYLSIDFKLKKAIVLCFVLAIALIIYYFCSIYSQLMLVAFGIFIMYIMNKKFIIDLKNSLMKRMKAKGSSTSL